MIEALVDKLIKHNIGLKLVDQENLGVLTDTAIPEELLAEIKQRKKELISYLKEQIPSATTAEALEQAPALPTYPLSSSQRRLWVLSQLEAGNAAYNMSGVYVLEGTLDRGFLSYAFEQVIHRHEILRTVFREEEDGTISQLVLNASAILFDLEYHDLREVGDHAAVVQTEVQSFINRPFDLSAGPLLRGSIYQLSADRWVFAYVMHHIISDGWSMSILIKELLQIYNARVQGVEDVLPVLRVQYKDYAWWQQSRLNTGAYEAHRTYWEDRFSGELPVLQLPQDHPRPAIKTYRGASISRALSETLLSTLRSCCRHQDSTLFMGLLSVVKVLLYRYSGQSDLVVGTPVAGREHADLEEQIGFYVNTLALRTQLNGDESFASLLSEVRRHTLDAYNHQSYPFDELVDGLQLQRDLSRSPLFDVMVVLQDNTLSGSSLPARMEGVNISSYEGAGTGTSKFDLVFNFHDQGNGLLVNLEYNSDIYEAGTATQLLRHFEQLLSALLSQPDTGIGEVAYLDASEQMELLETFNNTFTPYPDDKTIVDLFEEQVSMHASRIAVVYEDRRLSYEELNAESNRLAAYLRDRYDIGPDDRIGLELDRSEWMIIAILGVLKSGGAYVPIDPAYPAERIAYMIKDSGCKVVLDAAALDIFKQEGSHYSTDNLPSLIHPDHLAYVIYTSGSTGNPKGVMITHRNVVRLFKTDTPLFDFTPDDVFTLFHSFCFDFSVWEMYGALLFGGKTVIVPRKLAQDSYLFSKLLRSESVTVLSQTPGAFYNLIEADKHNDVGDVRLRYVIFGGEALNPAKLNSWKERYPATRLINMYGITETTVHVSFKEIKEEEIRRGISNIGKAIPTLSCYILDEKRNLVPKGVIGELYIGGAGVARGYLGNPSLTAQHFISNPFRSEERMYKTGDLGRWLPDGEIEFIGRRDDQVKIRGHRIELGEIEQALLSHPEVEAVVTIAMDGGEVGKQLIAYLAGHNELNIQELRTYLGGRLPAYMIPAYYIQQPSLPLNENGKVDKKRLPPPEKTGLQHGAEYIPPRNAVEKHLLKIWQELLGWDRISIKDNFFELGGNSLNATRLSSRIHKELGVRLPLGDIFSRPALEEQAKLISNNRQTAFEQIPSAPAQDRYKVSSSQHRLWVLSQLETGNIAYNIPGLYVFDGLLDMASLSSAFEQVIQRHEILRTVFREEDDGTVIQVVLDTSAILFGLEYQDLRATDDPDTAVRALVASYSNRSFDLNKGPLLRGSLYQLSANRWVFAYVMHHIISDGWSMSILIKELLQIYNDRVQGRAAVLPPLRLQYKDYACWQQTQLNSGAYEAHRTYWHNRFSGELPVLQLPQDYTRPSVKTYHGSNASRIIGEGLLPKLQTCCRNQDSTLFMGLLSVVKVLLYRYSGQEDLIVGCPIAGREHGDLEEQIGFYVNTLALRTQVRSTESFTALMDQVRLHTLEAYSHQSYPFDELVDSLQLKRDLSRSPLFDVMVVLRDGTLSGSALPDSMEGVTISAYEGAVTDTSKFDLVFYFREEDTRLIIDLEYNSDIYGDGTVTRMLAHFEQLLSALLSQPDTSINSLEYLHETEQQELLEHFNNTAIPYPRDKTIVDLFEEQVQRTPSHTAVVFREHSLSYQELNEQSNRLARYLRDRYGVGPDELVGLQLERNEWMVITMLGVLKSGGAYVPIDPEYPAERIAYLVKDSSCKLVLDAAALEAFRLEESHYSSENLPAAIYPDHLAYVTYTSGSTGNPKGMMMQHGNVVNLIDFHINGFLQIGVEKVSQFASISFDVSFQEIFSTLLRGATIYPIPEEIKRDAIALVDFLLAYKIDTVFLPTAYFKILMEDPCFIAGINPWVKHIIVAGEQLVLGDMFIEYLKNSQLQLHNNYGPSETHLATNHTLNRENIAGAGYIPTIGKPIQNHRIYILNEAGRLQPIGVSGEICIGGAGVGRGYLHNVSLTSEKFLPDPFHAGDRMYRTGDLGRWQADGTIEFLGRRDDQVKIRGYRIELGEIEQTLQSHPQIDAAVVLAVAREGAQMVKELVAYIVGTTEISIPDLRNYLGARLPAYMLPGYFIQLPSLPLNTNGKLDRKQLPSPETLGLQSGAAYVAPRNAIEEQLAIIWQDMLGRDRISVKDNFFELGGHSLKATRLASRIHKDLQVRLPLSDIFSQPVLEDQAKLIANSVQAVFESINPAPGQEHYELSASQKRLWLLDRLGIDARAYRIYGTYRFEGNIVPSLLQRSIKKLIERHEALRTLFIEVEGVPNQVILATDTLCQDAGYLDILENPTGQDLENAERNVFAHEFKLDKWPLFKACLVKTQETASLLFSMHHIISDGWSMDIFARDLLEIYRAEEQKREIRLPQLRIQYKDYAYWQNAHFSGEQQAASEDYWKTQLAGTLPDMRLPCDQEPYTNKSDDHAACFNVYIDNTLYESINRFIIPRKISGFSFLTACFKIVLYKLTGEPDIIVGTPVANRDHNDVKDVIGFFLNTLLLRDKLIKEESFGTFLHRANETILKALEHQSYPFERLLDILNIRRDLNQFPVTPVFLNMLKFDATDKETLTDLTPQHSKDAGFAKFDLECSFREYTNGMGISCTYRTRLFNARSIEYWINEFVSVIRQVLQEPEISIKNIRLFDTAPFVFDMPQPANPFRYFEEESIYQSLVTRFEEQVLKFPDNSAIIQDGQHMTYSRLNELANGLASVLSAQQGGGAHVALLLEHGVSAIIGMLGVLKSGNCYVPLDPNYPVDRLQYMLQDADCKTIITSDTTLTLARELSGAYAIANMVNISRDINPEEKNPGIIIPPDSKAYILYTSGSTGNPKGVIQTHSNVLHFIRVYTNNLHIAASDQLSLLPTYSFDAAVMDIYGAILNGACLHPYDIQTAGIASLGEWLELNKISILHTVPTIYRYFIASAQAYTFSHVRLLVLGGEAVYKSDFEKFKEHFLTGALLINGYGPTESTITLQKFLDHNSLVCSTNIPVGYPVTDTWVYLLDEQGEQAGVYQVGEIVYKSNYLALGYLNNREQTASAFTIDPLTKDGRVYRSGDMGRRLPSGEIEFIGRKDSQVKMNGLRIELAEIEQQLLKISNVEETIVLLRNVAGKDQLVAYVRAGKELTAAVLRQKLGKLLPLYMVPHIFLFLEKFPLTPTGKISRLDLPAPTAMDVARTEYVAPANEIEIMLVQIMQEVLALDRIGIRDNYFDLGGDSLSTIKVLSRIRKEFGINFRLEEVFVNYTVEELAREVSRRIWALEEVKPETDEMITLSL